MKRWVIGLAAGLALPAMAMAQETREPNKPAGSAAEQAVPEMKNPGGTEKLHPPQKAMDEATEAAPGKSDSSTGAGSGESGEGKTFNADELKKQDMAPQK